ncbi:hypothetical protein [Micromonospora maritima]|uniref:hypothetical protein n=1 Tax=Micromonospora maritima TaxID=986711 RepID=UPI0031E5FE52
MARRRVTAPPDELPPFLRVFRPADWPDRPGGDDDPARPWYESPAAWWLAPLEHRAGARWLAAWLDWHDGQDVDLVDAMRARLAARRAWDVAEWAAR